ncbi:uncharacterized protein MELLADRAFT_103237 [Melampsora larici-populina 98AG31]|uniref:Uncharacterized protein n=1 Tax=Melampsora larici-populina (strain 98AG31 / pathotype 3-4-7) TaxID=747676 RepID=F4RAZ9_MELLP|nr:uncharacterized protein MELLADRAFT_103237 [Melampsora larici-populina 98AG31]EGG10688.1 hypothetical protein MELLADRAFT_103237 [Melampsora larici-populina 98AG31]
MAYLGPNHMCCTCVALGWSTRQFEKCGQTHTGCWFHCTNFQKHLNASNAQLAINEGTASILNTDTPLWLQLHYLALTLTIPETRKPPHLDDAPEVTSASQLFKPHPRQRNPRLMARGKGLQKQQGLDIGNGIYPVVEHHLTLGKLGEVPLSHDGVLGSGSDFKFSSNASSTQSHHDCAAKSRSETGSIGESSGNHLNLDEDLQGD